MGRDKQDELDLLHVGFNQVTGAHRTQVHDAWKCKNSGMNESMSI